MAGNFRPLAGVRIVDFTTLAAGPACAKLLTDFGAETILLESESQIAKSVGSRQVGPPGVSPVNTGYFHNKFNTNKMSLTVDLARDEGKRIVHDLLQISDVFIANRLPRVLEQFHLTYEHVSRSRPDIVYLAMPTMGSGGPRSFYSGVSWGIQAMAGLDAISGYPDLPPSSPSPFSHPDVSCNPLHAAVAILAALRNRRRTGQGQKIELAQYESSISWTGAAILQYTATGELMPRTGNAEPSAAPHDVYRCLGDDAWCAISIRGNAEWSSLCHVIERPDLIEDVRFAELSARQARTNELREAIEPWTSTREAETVMAAMQAAGVPCAVLNDADHLLNHDPQLRERQLWTEAPHPELGTAIIEGWGFRFSEETPVSRRAPLLGEHNDHVLQNLIGMSEDEVNLHRVQDVLR
jgi:benzylsuccinate CoA-transferase BbsF subunit